METAMDRETTLGDRRRPARLAFHFIVYVLCGLAIFVLGSPFYSRFPTNRNQGYYVGLVLFFLLLSVVFRSVGNLRKYAPIVYAFAIASSALLFLSTGILNLHRTTDPNPYRFMALDKLSQSLHVVPVIVLLTVVAGNDLGSIYLKRGKLRTGLSFGLVSFVVFAAIGAAQAVGSGALDAALPSLHWILVFVGANAIMEELWFRGLFLKAFERHVGRWPSIICTSMVFGAPHIFATYVSPAQGVLFGILVFGLGVVGAHSIYRTDSLWGAVLFHAGYDLVVILPIVASMA